MLSLTKKILSGKKCLLEKKMLGKKISLKKKIIGEKFSLKNNFVGKKNSLKKKNQNSEIFSQSEFCQVTYHSCISYAII